MANEYKKSHGGAIDANFNDMLDKYAEAHPAFNPKDYDKLTQLVSGEPSEKAGAGGPIVTPPPPGTAGPTGLPALEDIQRERERRGSARGSRLVRQENAR